MKTKRAIWKTALSFLLAAALLAAGIPAAAYEALGADDALQPAAASAAIHPMSYRPRRRRKWWARSRSRRSETGKVYRLSDGSYAAVDYGRAVHYRENGTWQDYDNRLAYADGEDGAGYENTAGDLRVRFAPNSASGQLVRIQTEQGSVRLSLVGAAKSRQASLYAPAPASDDALALENLSAGVIYRDILEHTDIEYRLDGGALKENIILRAAGSGTYSYTFELKLSGLAPTLEDNGDVRLTSTKTGETALVLPKGYMYDAAGAESAAVSYTLTEANGQPLAADRHRRQHMDRFARPCIPRDDRPDRRAYKPHRIQQYQRLLCV